MTIDTDKWTERDINFLRHAIVMISEGVAKGAFCVIRGDGTPVTLLLRNDLDTPIPAQSRAQMALVGLLHGEANRLTDNFQQERKEEV